MNNEETFYRMPCGVRGVTRQPAFTNIVVCATSLGLGAGMAPKLHRRWRINRAFRWYGSRSGMHLLYRIFYPLRSPTGEGRHPFPDFPRLRRYDETAAGTGRKKSLKTSSRNTMANMSSPLKVIRRWASRGCSVSAAVDRLLKLKRAAAGASAIIARGTCASRGCVQAARQSDAGSACRQSHHRQTYYQSTAARRSDVMRRHHYLHGDL